MKFTREVQVVGNRYFLHFAECADISCFKYFARQAVVTAGVNGKHSEKSLHYKFKAWDLRVWVDELEPGKGRFSNEACEEMAAYLRTLLGGLYDVVVEYKKDRNGDFYVSHIHSEYDPI